jgi:hypothetical protein
VSLRWVTANPTSTGDGIAYNALRTILGNFGISPQLFPLPKYLPCGYGDLRTRAASFTFARKNGVKVGQFFSMISETLFACPLYKNYGMAIIDRQFYEPLFKMALGAKDMNLVSSSAKECQTPMRFASVLQDRFTASLAKGRKNYDWIGIALDVEEEAGITSGS